MSKKIVRGITDVKTITEQDFDTNNVNDLLSDGQYNYIHRKKGKSKEYHNLTDNIKTILSDNTDLLTVTNNNKTNNTATLHPKHDAQKEQVLESERNTVTINHGTNATPEKTKVDTNPQKVLEHENLTVDSSLTKTHTGNTTNLKISNDFVTKVNNKQDAISVGKGLSFSNNKVEINPTYQDLVTTENGIFTGLVNDDGEQNIVISLNNRGTYIQLALRNSTSMSGLLISKYRFIIDDIPTSWKNMLVDEEKINTLIDQKIANALKANEATDGKQTTIEE